MTGKENAIKDAAGKVREHFPESSLFSGTKKVKKQFAFSPLNAPDFRGRFFKEAHRSLNSKSEV